MFAELSPKDFKQVANHLLKLSERTRPDAINEERPESVKSFIGRFWDHVSGVDPRDYPTNQTQVNIVFGAYNAFLPVLLSRLPVPAARAVKGDHDYADAANRMKTYKDSKFSMREHNRMAFQDCFLRGTGFLRHCRDEDAGCSRSKYFNARCVYPDHAASRWGECNHIIEKHTCTRLEAIDIFGRKIGLDLPKAEHREESGDKKFEEVEACDGWKRKFKDKNPLDMIEYYLLWSKHDQENRVFAFHKEYDKAHLWKNRKDKKPGDPFPFEFPRDKWHLTPLMLNCENNKLWGMSFFDGSAGIIKFLQFAISWCMDSSKTSAKQLLLYPEQFGDLAMRIQNCADHLAAIGYPDTLLQSGGKLSDFISTFEFPPLAQTLLDMIKFMKAWLGEQSGLDAVQMDSANLETAAEAQAVNDSNQNRVKDMRRTVEAFLVDSFQRELEIDAKLMPTRSVICWYPRQTDPEKDEWEDLDPDHVGDEEEYEPDRDDAPTGIIPGYKDLAAKVAAGGDELHDIPYDEAVMLEKGPASIKQAATQEQMVNFWGAQFAKEHAQPNLSDEQLNQLSEQFWQMVEQRGIDPAVLARLKRAIPMDARVEILEPGAEAFIADENQVLSQELLAAWKKHERATDREIRREVAVEIAVGSTSESAAMMKINKLAMVDKIISPGIDAMGLPDKKKTFHNLVVGAIEEPGADGLRITDQEFQQGQQAIQQAQQQQMQMEMAKKQQPQTDPGKVQVAQLQKEAEETKQRGNIETAKIQSHQTGLETQQHFVKGHMAQQLEQQRAARDRTQGAAQQVAGPQMGV